MSEVKPKTQAEKSTRTTVDTISFTAEQARSWALPPFQRELTVNSKVKALSEAVKNDGGVLPGVLTFGIFNRVKYIVDGQHRRESFLLSGLEEGYADVRTCFFDDMAEMGEEYVRLNSSLVRIRPDDILRGLEQSIAALQKIRAKCPFIGYDYIRRSVKNNAPLLSMSVALRCWDMSRSDIAGGMSRPAVTIARELHDDDVAQLSDFLGLAVTAWGRDEEYSRMWGSLNLCLCMWLYRRMIVSKYSAKTKIMTKDLFSKCLMALSSSSDYLDWLYGRKLGERDRAPAYNRIKILFYRRMKAEGFESPLPAPAWSGGTSNIRRLKDGI